MSAYLDQGQWPDGGEVHEATHGEFIRIVPAAPRLTFGAPAKRN